MSPLNPQLLGIRVLLEYQTGEFAQGEVHLERLLDVMRQDGTDQFNAFQRVAFTIPAAARFTGVQDRFDIAESAAETVLSEMSPTPHTARYVRVGLALLAPSSICSATLKCTVLCTILE